MRSERRAPLPRLDLLKGEGEVAGITYRVQGAGPLLVLLPFGAASSQWEPLIPRLARDYCTITLGGPQLGWAGRGEQRAASVGFQDLYRSLAQDVQVRPGRTVLDVGCGPGTMARWLASWTERTSPIVGVDVSRYMLREARALARKAGLDTAIAFQEANAESLSFPDRDFDVALSVTLLEEVDAERALAEMVRVTKPGESRRRRGAVDCPGVGAAGSGRKLKTQAQVPGSGAGVVRTDARTPASITAFNPLARWCSVRAGPRMISEGLIRDAQEFPSRPVDRDQTSTWRTAAATAARVGTSFVAYPFHYAVGTRA